MTAIYRRLLPGCLTIFASYLISGVGLAQVSAAQAAQPNAAAALAGQQGISVEQAEADLTTQWRTDKRSVPAEISSALGTAYAGVWFNNKDGRWAVGAPSSTATKAATAAAESAGIGKVEVIPVKTTWAELAAAQKQFDETHRGLFARRELETAIVPSQNTVVVSLSSAASEATKDAVRTLVDASEGRLSVEAVPPTTLQFTSDTTTCTPSSWCPKPLVSGVEVYSTPEKETQVQCTAGPLMRGPNGYTYMTFAGHCAEGEYTGEKDAWYSQTPYNEVGAIGDVAQGSTHLEEYGDYSEVLINSPFWTLAGDTPLYADVAEWKTADEYVVVGQTASYEGLDNCHEGYHSGEQCGTVEAVDVTAAIKYDLDIGERVIDVHELVRDSACADKGDSGGPFLSTPSFEVDGQASMEGITVASAGECFAKPSLYEPLQIIEEVEGLELLTYYNQTG